MKERVFLQLDNPSGHVWFDADDVMGVMDVGVDECKVFMGDGYMAFHVTLSAADVVDKLRAAYEIAARR